MNAAKHLDGYGEESTLRCERVLATVLRSIGAPWHDRVCLIGGLVPRYLLPEGAGTHLVPHIGSTDVDVALGLLVGRANEGAYATLETNLKRAGLERYKESSWRWSIEIDGFPVILELVGDDGKTESGTLFRPAVKPPAGAGGIALLCVRGVELALQDRVVVERELALLDGARSTVRIPVAGLASFVALKADVYLDRREPKDVYDLLYVIRNWPGGPKEAARVAAASPVFTEVFVTDALERLSEDFRSANHVGPRDYGLVMTGQNDGPENTAMRAEAMLAFGMFARALGPEDEAA